MSHHDQHDNKSCNTACEEDGCADAFAAVALVTLFVAAMSFWLSGMP